MAAFMCRFHRSRNHAEGPARHKDFLGFGRRANGTGRGSTRLKLEKLEPRILLAADISILFAGGGVTPTSGADGTFLTFLEDTYGAANVTYSRVNEVNAGNLAGFNVDVLILSSTPSSGNIRNKFQDNSIGIVNWEEAIVDCAVGEFCMSLGRPKDNVATPHTVELTAAGHPIQGVLPNGQITWADNPGGGRRRARRNFFDADP